MFDRNCSKYDHYLEAVKYEIGLIDDKPYDIDYNVFNIDIFNSVWMYAQSDEIPVIFDSGCTIAVTPHASDFINQITLVDKIMKGLDATTKVVGEGINNWNFRDDY